VTNKEIMNVNAIAFSLIALAILTSCHKPPTSVFVGDVYRSLDGQRALTLTSPDECDFRDGKTTLICKYTKQPDGLRVVMTVNGTDQVNDFHFTNEGIQGNDGPALLSTQHYTLQMLEIRQEKERNDLLKQ